LPDYGSKLGVQQMTVMDERVGLALRSTVSYDPNALGVQVTLDVLYGVKVMRAEHIVAITHALGGNV
jgi:hypothetical protein